MAENRSTATGAPQNPLENPTRQASLAQPAPCAQQDTPQDILQETQTSKPKSHRKPKARRSSSSRPSARKSSSRKWSARRSPAALSQAGRTPDTVRRAANSANCVGPGQQPRVRIGSPTALLAAVPGLLGFQPENSMVVVGTEHPRALVRLTLRYDLPDPPDARMAAELARHAVGVLAAQRIRSAVAVGYGPGHQVTPVADALRQHAPGAGIQLTELLRAENQRYWSYVCAEPACCPPEGTPFDVTDHPVTRAFAAAGTGGVLSSRSELAATLAPVEGELAEAMRRATRAAEEHRARLVARVARSGRRAAVRRLIATAGVQSVTDAISRYRHGDSIGPETAAWLTVVLRDLRVRDDAWSRMLPEYRKAHLRMWSDLTRMARPGYVPAPAALLAFVAWQSGNGALANVALDRALADDPDYSMAKLLRQAIDSGIPPSVARLPMTPEEVAASYDAQDEAAEAAGGAESEVEIRDAASRDG